MLVADGCGELRFWDLAGSGGPIAGDELPLSSERVAEFKRLSSAFRPGVVGARRTKLGRSSAIGLRAPGMSRPVWDSGEPTDDEDDEF